MSRFASCVEARELVFLLVDFFLGGHWQDRVDCLFRGEHLVKVRDIEGILGQFRLEFWIKFLVEKSLAVDTGKPRMGENILYAIYGTDSILRVFFQTFGDEILAFIAHVDTVLLGIWEENWFCLD